MLISARLSLQARAVESACIETLGRCIHGIQKEYNISESDLDEGLVWRETSFAGTLRLLEYVAGEVRERLNNPTTADEIALCVDALASQRRLSRQRCEIVRAPPSAKGPWPLSKIALRRQ